MGNLLSVIVSGLNFLPGYKTRIAAVAAFALAVVSAYNGAAPSFEFPVLQVPEWINSAVLALLGVGAANQITNSAPKP
jgi:hypothetical protein